MSAKYQKKDDSAPVVLKEEGTYWDGREEKVHISQKRGRRERVGISPTFLQNKSVRTRRGRKNRSMIRRRIKNRKEKKLREGGISP